LRISRCVQRCSGTAIFRYFAGNPRATTDHRSPSQMPATARAYGSTLFTIERIAFQRRTPTQMSDAESISVVDKQARAIPFLAIALGSIVKHNPESESVSARRQQCDPPLAKRDGRQSTPLEVARKNRAHGKQKEYSRKTK